MRPSIITTLFLMCFGNGLAQSTFLERTSPNPAGAQLFFYDRTYDTNAERNWKIATLPASTSGTGDKILIELFGGTAASSTTFQQVIHLGNRGGFNGYLRYTLGPSSSSTRIRAYSESDGSVSVYFSLLSPNWKGSSIRIYDGSAITNTRLTIYPDPQNVGPNPTGTLVFDSFTEVPAYTIENDKDVLYNGNVGIGTTTPNEKLCVNGTIRAKEIKVEAAPWPDYVFEEGFKKPKLDELEDFITENHHLPGMPTAAQVDENGVALGELNAKLLEQLEVLTLYIIEQNKRLEAQQSQIEELQKYLPK